MDCNTKRGRVLFAKSRAGVRFANEKVGIFRSIHLKFVTIYVLLILVAIQIIGVYFVRELEKI